MLFAMITKKIKNNYIIQYYQNNKKIIKTIELKNIKKKRFISTSTELKNSYFIAYIRIPENAFDN